MIESSRRRVTTRMQQLCYRLASVNEILSEPSMATPRAAHTRSILFHVQTVQCMYRLCEWQNSRVLLPGLLEIDQVRADNRLQLKLDELSRGSPSSCTLASKQVLYSPALLYVGYETVNGHYSLLVANPVAISPRKPTSCRVQGYSVTRRRDRFGRCACSITT